MWLGLALLLGVAAGCVMGGVAGARRTASANERFREAHSAYDLLVSVRCREPDGTSREPAASRAACLEAVRQLPSVADVAVVEEVSGFIATADGTSVQPFPDDSCYSGPGRVEVHGDRTGRFGTEFNEMRIVAGRRADPAAADEVVLSKSTADRLGIGPGTVLQLSPFDSDDCFEPSAWDPPIELRVVGVGLSPGEVPPPSGEYFASVQVTPAFLVEHAPMPTRESGCPRPVATRGRRGDVARRHRQHRRAGPGVLRRTRPERGRRIAGSGPRRSRSPSSPGSPPWPGRRSSAKRSSARAVPMPSIGRR